MSTSTPPCAVPKAAPFDEKKKAPFLCDEKVMLRWPIEHAAINLERHRPIDYSVGQRSSAGRVRDVFHGSLYVSRTWSELLSERSGVQHGGI